MNERRTKALNGILKTSERLASISERINEGIRDFEDQLAAAGAIGPCWIAVESTIDDWKPLELGYTKLNKEWKLAVRTSSSNERSLLSAPRQVRNLCWRRFDDLAFAILSHMQDLESDTTKSCEP